MICVLRRHGTQYAIRLQLAKRDFHLRSPFRIQFLRTLTTSSRQSAAKFRRATQSVRDFVAPTAFIALCRLPRTQILSHDRMRTGIAKWVAYHVSRRRIVRSIFHIGVPYNLDGAQPRSRAPGSRKIDYGPFSNYWTPRSLRRRSYSDNATCILHEVYDRAAPQSL